MKTLAENAAVCGGLCCLKTSLALCFPSTQALIHLWSKGTKFFPELATDIWQCLLVELVLVASNVQDWVDHVVLVYSFREQVRSDDMWQDQRPDKKVLRVYCMKPQGWNLCFSRAPNMLKIPRPWGVCQGDLWELERVSSKKRLCVPQVAKLEGWAYPSPLEPSPLDLH